jgi:hypothetical protein
MIQPNCRHYAAGLTQECHLLACHGECNHNQGHRIVETSRVRREWHVQGPRQGHVCFCQIDCICASFNITPSMLGALLEAYIETQPRMARAMPYWTSPRATVSTIDDTRDSTRKAEVPTPRECNRP